MENNVLLCVRIMDVEISSVEERTVDVLGVKVVVRGAVARMEIVL